MATQRIFPSLWFGKDVEAAAKFYVSIFPESKIDRVTTLNSDSPSGPAGSVVVVEFTLRGAKFSAMQAGPLDDFNHAISFIVDCEDQAEIDRYYDALLADGGKEENCGWVADKFGVRWQIVPRQLMEMHASPDRAAAKRAGDAMLKMKKLDLAALQAAFSR